MFTAIPLRQCTRGDDDGKALSSDELALLQRAGSSDTVRLLLLTERPAMEQTLDHVIQGNSAQLADAAFVKELKHWIRFNGADAVRTRDGLYSVSSGIAVALRCRTGPEWPAAGSRRAVRAWPGSAALAAAACRGCPGVIDTARARGVAMTVLLWVGIALAIARLLRAEVRLVLGLLGAGAGHRAAAALAGNLADVCRQFRAQPGRATVEVARTRTNRTAGSVVTALLFAGAKFVGFDRGWHVWVGHDDEVMAEILKLLDLPAFVP